MIIMMDVSVVMKMILMNPEEKLRSGRAHFANPLVKIDSGNHKQNSLGPEVPNKSISI